MTRAERAAEAAELRSQGLLGREIAERMGISTTYAYALLNDPTGEADRARKGSYGGTCKRCGKRTDGSNGFAKAPEYCRDCAPDAHRFWTREAVIEAIHEFHRRYGRRPVVCDWNRSPAMRLQWPDGDWDDIDRRWEEGCWPGVNTVQQLFGSWSAGLEAAGFQAPCGYYHDEVAA